MLQKGLRNACSVKQKKAGKRYRQCEKTTAVAKYYGFGCRTPGTKTGTRVRSHVPPERKPERG